MLIAPEIAQPGSRTHPWESSGHKQGVGAYYDFTRQPDLIPSVLEDFIPHADRLAVQRFYEFLRWVNISPESVLETNDCAMRPPHENGDSLFKASVKSAWAIAHFLPQSRRQCSFRLLPMA